MLEVEGHTRVEFLSETLEDDKEVFRRSVELLTFLITVQRESSGLLEFAMEPAAVHRVEGCKVRLFDFFQQDRLLDEFHLDTVKANISSIDQFLSRALEAHSPLLLDHLLHRRFLGPAFDGP